MKLCFAGVLQAATLMAQVAQQDVTPPIVQGTLTLADSGVIEVSRVAGTPVRCSFDSHTWIEQDRKQLSLTALEPGLSVEILTDLRGGRCYTRTIRIVPAAAPSPVTRRGPIRPTRSATIENFYPRGNLTFGGVVLRRSATLLVLRTRTEREQLVRLREDTRFLDSGSPATAGDVAINSRVFVRAGKSIDNELEAYQVIWGEIAGPKTITSQ